MPATFYAAEKGITPSAQVAQAMGDMAVGDVESAATSARLFANIVARKKRSA